MSGPWLNPFGVVWSPDGRRVYITDVGLYSRIVDAATRGSLDVIEGGWGGAPYAIAITRDGRKLYIARAYDNQVKVIDTATDPSRFFCQTGLPDCTSTTRTPAPRQSSPRDVHPH
jgi:DNA-binding beta-propeller fold protein YncE